MEELNIDLEVISLIESKDQKAVEKVKSEELCGCIRVIGHLEDVTWMLWPRQITFATGPLALADWTENPHIWMHYVESSDGILAEDDVLRSTNARYWSIHDVQRYFVGEMHCEKVLFTYQYPNLRMPTRLANHRWKSNAATKITPAVYHKQFVSSMEITQKKMEMHEDQMDRLIVSDQLINLERCDYFKRKTFFKLLMNILSIQDHLQLVSLENLRCKRVEGVRLIQQISCFNAHTLKYLFLWRFVLPNENPLLINYRYITGTGQYIPRPDSRQCFLRSLANLKQLRILALEFSHIADSTGGALVSLIPIMKKPHFRLQLICREEQVPGYTDAALGVGGHDIPDTAWRRVAVACPDLYVLMAFHCVRDYDDVRRFLTPSIPLRETHLQLGIDLKLRQRQDSDISCFVRHIAFRYASTLVTLSIHQWRFALFPLRRIFELMPFLVRFFYVGRVEDEVDLHMMLRVIACGVHYKLKQISIQIQDEESKREYWRQTVDSLTKEYHDIMVLYDINFCLSIYKG